MSTIDTASNISSDTYSLLSKISTDEGKTLATLYENVAKFAKAATPGENAFDANDFTNKVAEKFSNRIYDSGALDSLSKQVDLTIKNAGVGSLNKTLNLFDLYGVSNEDAAAAAAKPTSSAVNQGGSVVVEVSNTSTGATKPGNGLPITVGTPSTPSTMSPAAREIAQAIKEVNSGSLDLAYAQLAKGVQSASMMRIYATLLARDAGSLNLVPGAKASDLFPASLEVINNMVTQSQPRSTANTYATVSSFDDSQDPEDPNIV